MAFLALVLLLTACRGPSRATSSASPSPVPPDEKGPFPLLEIDPNSFDDRSIDLTNQYLPFKPGLQLVYEGSTQEGSERIPHRVITTITDLTKKIYGVRTLVQWERDFEDDELVEAELTFFAQDKEGNIWHLGQYSEIWEEGEFTGGRVWTVGMVQGAKAGIMMKAKPDPKAPSYSEGFAPPPYNWDDRARVHLMNQKTCIKLRCYDNVLVMDEFEGAKPGAHQLKFYAPGVGNIKVGWFGPKEQEKETLELVKITNLDPGQLAVARSEAFILEQHAYDYGRTEPAQPR